MPPMSEHSELYSPEVSGSAVDVRLLPDNEVGSDDMSLNRQDREWIQQAIARTLTPQKSAPDSEITSPAKRSSWTVEKMGTVAGLVVIVTTAVWSEATFRASSDGRLTNIERSLAEIKTDFGELRKTLDQVRDKQSKNALKFSPSTPSDQDAKDIKEAADHLLRRKLDVDVESIRTAAGPLFSQITPAKWDAAISLVNLRSFANASLDIAKRSIMGKIDSQGDLGKWVNIPGRGYLEYSPGGTLLLDATANDYRQGHALYDAPGHRAEVYERIVVKNMHVVYHGRRPVTLINVFFENCTFDLADTPHGHEFARAVLSSAFTNFKG